MENKPTMSSFVMRISKRNIDKQITKATFATKSNFRCTGNSEVQESVQLLRRYALKTV